MSDLLLVSLGIALVAAAVIVLVIMFFGLRRRSLSASSRAKIRKAWANASAMENSVIRILEADKVLDLALSQLGYRGSLGQKLKTAGPRFSNIDHVWSAHKLRNRLAHEHGAGASEHEVQQAMRAFERAIEELL